MSKLTQAQSDLMTAGICTRCGSFAESRNTAGQCCACHNLQCREREAAQKQARAVAMAEGRQYWHSRGIIIGERLTACLSSVFSPAGEVVYGLAAVGSRGAYVKCYGKKCIPGIFDKIKKKGSQ